MTTFPIPSPYEFESIRRTRSWVIWTKRLLLALHLARFARHWRGRSDWAKYTGGWNAPSPKTESPLHRLNLGCGDADYIGYVNLDLAPVSCAHVRAIGQALPFKEGSFDEVLCTDVIEHLSASDGKHLLSESFRVLDHGGHLILVTPDLDNIISAYAGGFASHEQTIQHLLGDARDHRYLYTIGLLAGCVRSSGFAIQRCIPYWGPIWAHTVILAEKP